MSKGRRILLVDDEPDNVRIFAITLRDAGFEVDAFEDPRMALSAFKPNHYDLLILDIRMRYMSGDQLYQKLRKLDDNLRSMFLVHMALRSTKLNFLPLHQSMIFRT